MGKAALEGQDGVVKVESGWHDGLEVNRVSYDQEKIGKKELETHLKNAGTYIKTFSSDSKMK